MNQNEFDTRNEARNQQFTTTHWPRAKKLLEEGNTPNEVVKQMASEGYWGFASTRFSLPDLYYLQSIAN